MSDPRCRSCGACCSTVTTDPAGWPAWWTEEPATQDLSNGMRIGVVGSRCEALVGTIGERVACGVYEARPGVCRRFPVGSAECQEARKLANLPPLC